MNGNFEIITNEVKNIKGKVLEKRLRLNPKKKNDKISLQETNKLYKKLLKSINPKNILIRCMAIDGIKTLKSYDHEGEDLLSCMEEYYSSMPKEVQDKFSHYLGIEIIIRNV